MKTDTKYHVFHQHGHDKPRTFIYGNRRKKFSEKEVDAMAKLLPKDHKVIRIIWCDPEEYLDYKRQREAESNIDKKHELEHLTNQENGNT